MHFTFTDRARKVLAMTREEAIRLRHDRVDTEHILLGLVREPAGIAAAALSGLSVDLAQLRERTEASVRRGKASIAFGELPYSSRAKKVLEFAMAEARELRHSHVGTEHLLLGLLREEQGLAAGLLDEQGVTLERARQEVQRLLGRNPPARSGTGATPGNWLRRLLGGEVEGGPERVATIPIGIDDNSSLSIYEQIVVQVQEAIATGRLSAGDRLATVRRLAEDLDIAPGTVARAYSEMERLGLVVTEGARGTRVAEQPKRPLAEARRPETLEGLLRPVAVAAFHLGATGEELRHALDRAMREIFTDDDEPGSG
jgi:DNA-binding transcriptional regulator YhcF (GntR family)